MCPACQGENVEPARAHGLDYLVKLIGSRPFRCGDCGERFRSTATYPTGPGREFPPSAAAEAVCPNCNHATVIRLTAGEQKLAVEDGWVVSCPGCRALFPFLRRSGDR